MRHCLLCILLLFAQSGCVVAVVDTAIDSTVAVVSLPVKAAAATASLVLPDGED
jgi:hypothetical protein